MVNKDVYKFTAAAKKCSVFAVKFNNSLSLNSTYSRSLVTAGNVQLEAFVVHSR